MDRPTRTARRLPLLLAGLLACTAASADQYQYLDLPQARAAADRLRPGDVVHLFCAPCGDRRSERMTVRSAGIERIWDRPGSAQPYRDGARSFWAVEINDLQVDLAYVYVRERGRWHNLADLLGLGPRDVPVLLEPRETGTRWRCGTDVDNPYWTIFEQRRDPCPVDAAALEAKARAEPGWR